MNDQLLYIKHLESLCEISSKDLTEFLSRTESGKRQISSSYADVISDDLVYILKFTIQLSSISQFFNANDLLKGNKKEVFAYEKFERYCGLDVTEIYDVLTSLSLYHQRICIKQMTSNPSLIQSLCEALKSNNASSFSTIISSNNISFGQLIPKLAFLAVNGLIDLDPSLVRFITDHKRDVLSQIVEEADEEIEYEDNDPISQLAFSRYNEQIDPIKSWIINRDLSIKDASHGLFYQYSMQLLDRLNSITPDTTINDKKSCIYDYLKFQYKLIISDVFVPSRTSLEKEIVERFLSCYYFRPLYNALKEEWISVSKKKVLALEEIADQVNLEYETSKTESLTLSEEQEEPIEAREIYITQINQCLLKKVKELAKDLARTDLELGPYIEESDIVTFYYRIGGKLLSGDSEDDIYNEHLKWIGGWASLKYLFLV